MKTINLGDYGPVISDKDVGNKVVNHINEALSSNEIVEIDLAGIKSMATFCAKQIFGNLYVGLGANHFFERIRLKNASQDIRIIIKIGIEHALSEGRTN